MNVQAVYPLFWCCLWMPSKIHFIHLVCKFSPGTIACVSGHFYHLKTEKERKKQKRERERKKKNLFFCPPSHSCIIVILSFVILALVNLNTNHFVPAAIWLLRVVHCERVFKTSWGKRKPISFFSLVEKTWLLHQFL